MASFGDDMRALADAAAAAVETVEAPAPKKRKKNQSFCGHCAIGLHRKCVEPCVCAVAEHEPDRALAARLGRYLNPSLAPDDAADQWLRCYGGDRLATV